MASHDIEFINILNQGTDNAVCSVLRIGDIRIMLDCGCNETLDHSMLEMVHKEAEDVQFVLISHATWMHVAALPYLKQKGVSARIIATSPIAKIGAASVHELFIGLKENPKS